MMIDKVNVDKDLMFFNKDKGKKVYEIKTEIQRYLTFQVVADNSDEAFEKYLDHAKVDVVDDSFSTEIVLSGQDEYDQYHDTVCIGTIKVDDDDETYRSPVTNNRSHVSKQFSINSTKLSSLNLVKSTVTLSDESRAIFAFNKRLSTLSP